MRLWRVFSAQKSDDSNLTRKASQTRTERAQGMRYKIGRDRGWGQHSSTGNRTTKMRLSLSFLLHLLVLLLGGYALVSARPQGPCGPPPSGPPPSGPPPSGPPPNGGRCGPPPSNSTSSG
ncbi:hypothetical protein KR222_008941 [Zaprionus bogoriensis]|nr:hypothetical protein KR222_008941 [Zaprionus bogoriensis]